MNDLIVYSLKVRREQLERARRFLARQGELLQDSLRGLIELAADCEQCLELEEEDASITEMQSALATLLAKCKGAWRLNGLLHEAVVRIAKINGLPTEFVNNVLGEARQIKPAVCRKGLLRQSS